MATVVTVPEEPRHLLVRFGDLQAPKEGTIKLHKEVADRYGEVWLGKFGKPISHDTLEMLRRQVSDGTETLVFLVTRTGQAGRGYGIYKVAKCRLLDARRDFPPSERKLIPKYYAPGAGVGAWLKIAKIRTVPASDLVNYVVASSMNPVPEALAGSMAGAFLIRKALDIHKIQDFDPA